MKIANKQLYARDRCVKYAFNIKQLTNECFL